MRWELTVANSSVLPDKGSTNGSTSYKSEGTAHGKNKRVVALPAFAAATPLETTPAPSCRAILTNLTVLEGHEMLPL